MKLENVKSSDFEGGNKSVQKSHHEIQKKTQAAKQSKNVYRYWVSDRSVGEFYYTFAFPAKVDRERLKANLKHGILTIVVLKLFKEAENKKILIGS